MVDFDGDVNLVEKEVVVLSIAGRKKGQQSGSRLEETAVAAGGRCWDGKEQLARDQIRSRSSREVGLADGSGAAEGWLQEKRDRADLTHKIDGREEASNSAVGRGRGPRLLRQQGQMRAATSAGCDNGIRQLLVQVPCKPIT
ncbi:hypothetical protein BHE74_00039091 [Ensete ventricosum]|nr:hypothetical protein BHE74_00039091 [Ensete ventricosum]